MMDRRQCSLGPGRRGFILLAIVGLLAVLLMLCISLLSRTSSELDAMAHARDRTDARNLVWSAADWMLGCISADLFDGADNYKPANFVSRCSNFNSARYNWWYKPFYADLAQYNSNLTATYSLNDAAKWIYMPADFFPEGGVRARFFVQVMDPNGFFNINDWLEDCNPTQCQMAHMLIGGGSPGYEGLWGAYARTTELADLSNPGQVMPPLVRVGDYATLPEFGTAANPPRWPYGAMRYLSAFNAVSRTLRYDANGTGDPGNSAAVPPIAPSMSPAWQTTNTPWYNVAAINNYALKPSSSQYYMANPNSWVAHVATNITRWAYSDPDTGRCPINVNTCPSSGEYVPGYGAWFARPWSLEAVFNVDSLRRIIQIGHFEDEAGNVYDLTQPGVYDGLSALNKRRVEIAKAKLAYQYQETLVRYFCAAYDLGSYRAYTWGRGPEVSPSGRQQLNNIYKPYAAYGRTGNPFLNYRETYERVLGAAEAATVMNHCLKADNSEPAFPYGVEDFRNRVKADLLAMCQRNRNVDGNNRDYTTSATGTKTYRWALYAGASDDGIATVGVDKELNLEILPGKLDWRTAAAIYDNIVPGKALLFNSVPAAEQTRIKTNHGWSDARLAGEIATTIDPLTDLYQKRIGRDERLSSEYHMDVLGAIRGRRYTDARGTPRDQPDNMGKDVSGAAVPWRQLAFGPDWFSTELTTASTNFIVTVHTQLVEAASIAAGNPRPMHEHVVQFVVELCPDVLAETPENGEPPGLGYYRLNRPAYHKTTDDALDGMDALCNTLATSVDPAALPGTGSPPFATRKTSRPLEWFDYRNVPAAQSADFYKNGGGQIKKRVFIRAIVDQNGAALSL